MVKYIRIYLSIICTIVSLTSYAQRDKYKLYIKANVPGKSSVNYKITYLGESVYSDYFEKVYDTDPGSRNVDVRFRNGPASIDIARTFNSDFCVKQTQDFWLGTPISARGNIYFQLIPPALKTPVGELGNTLYEGKTIKIKTEGVNDGDYVWEISRDATTWKEIETTSSPILELTGSKLSTFYGTNRIDTYGKFYIRVKPKDGCTNDRISDPNVFYYNPPAPTGKPAKVLCEKDILVLNPDPLCALWSYCQYTWQVSEDGGASWKNLVTTSSSNYAFNLDMITVSAPKFDTSRMIRYKKKDWGDELASAPVEGIVYHPQSGSITDLETVPPSCKGKPDGKIIVKSVSGGTPTVLIRLKNGYTYADIKTKEWDKSSPYTFNDVSNGYYIVQIENIGIGITACETNYYLSIDPKPILQFTEVKKVDPTCNKRSDGSIEVNVADGLTPREYTLYKNDGKGVWIEQTSISKTESNHIFSALSSGNYKVVASDGCQVINQEIALQNPVFTIDTVSTTPAYCGLAYGKITVQMSGGKSPYTYSWKYGNQILSTTTATAENLLPGIYTITGTDANGCSGPLLSVELLEGIHPSLEVKTIRTGCGLAKGEAVVKITQGFAPYTFIWKDKNGIILRTLTRIESEDTLKNLVKGNYILQVEDSKKCQVQTNVAIDEYDPITIQLSSSTLASCPESSDGVAKIEVKGGLAPYIYEWNDEKKQIQAEASNLKVGTYKVKVTDALGCHKEHTVEVKSIPELTFSETIKPPTCYETCDAAIDVQVSGGTPPYKYMWSTGSTTSSIEQLCEGSYSLTVEDAKKCVKTVSYKIVKPAELLGVLKEKEATICSGQIMTLDAGEWKSYSWKNGGGNIIGQDRILKITQAGNYFLEVTNSYGCVIKDQFTLHTSTSLLEAKIIFASPAVVGDTVVLTEVSWPKPESWTWTYPSQLITYDQGPAPSQQQVILSEPGTYSIEFIAGLGECRDTIVKTITVLPKSEASNLINQISSVLGSKAITKLSLYPNPNNGKFTLEITLEKAAPIQIQLYGWQSTDPIYQNTFEENTIHKQELEILGLSNGLYVVVIYVAGEKPRLIKMMIE